MTRLQAVAFDIDALVDGGGDPYPDAPRSLLAAHEAGLRVVVVAAPGAPPADRATAAVPVPVDAIALVDGAPLPLTMRAAGLQPQTTLLVVTEPDAAGKAKAAGVPTALVDRCGRCSGSVVDHRWRDLIGLVPLCAAMPAPARSVLRC